jgi:hypothetical protein
LLNYALLTPGVHMIGVEISAPGETPLVIERAVTTVRPGNAEFLTSFSLSGASAAVDGNDIVVGGADLGSSGGTTKTNLRLGFLSNSQGLTVLEAFNGTNAAAFNAVQAVFTAKCAIPDCHSGSIPQAAQDLSDGQAFRNTVAVRSVEFPSLPRVSPGDPDGSYLVHKIEGRPGIVGERMPQGCGEGNCLSDEEIDTIRQWILDGARPAE